MNTMPVSIRLATRFPRATSRVKIEPPNPKSESLARALRDNGVECEYLLFNGEGHGFHRAETIVRALSAELAFYGRVLGFTPG